MEAQPDTELVQGAAGGPAGAAEEAADKHLPEDLHGAADGVRLPVPARGCGRDTAVQVRLQGLLEVRPPGPVCEASHTNRHN